MTLTTFESIKHMNEYGQEYWLARELQSPLGYDRWESFENTIHRAVESCKNSNQKPQDHFRDVTKMVPIGSGTKRGVDDYHLSRYACYLIAQNGDPRKPEIALAQTYFAIQTHRQETSDMLAEDQKRLFLREEMTVHNKDLARTAKEAGVWNYGEFTDFGYMGLYGGKRAKDIHAKKRLKPTQKILDHMGSEELAANLFRATQAEAKIKREGIAGQEKASKAHYEVGKTIRATIREIGGTMPENLPIAEDVRESKKRVKGEEKRRLGGV